MKKRLIVIPFNLPWDWSTDYTNQTAFVLGKDNPVICYMIGDIFSIKEYLVKKKFPVLIKKYSRNVYLFYPILFVPFIRFKEILYINEKINIWLLKVFIKFIELKFKVQRKIVWNFDPQFGYLTKYFNRGWIKVYDCVDYFAGSAKTEEAKDKLLLNEKKLAKVSDFVFANSIVLEKHLKKIRSDVVLVPQGFRVGSFENFPKSNQRLKKAGRPLIGFVGAVNSRIDYDLLYDLAKKHPEWDLALWGKKLEKDSFTKRQSDLFDKLILLPNIIHGQSEKSEIPGIVDQFDIGMIPYDPNNDFNKYCYPMKLFEFFYLGKSVISTNIEELRRFPDLVYIGNKVSDWEGIIKKLLKTKWPRRLRVKEKRLSIENSWENKIGQILNHIDMKYSVSSIK